MISNYKELIGIIAIAITFVSYIPYFRDIFTGKTKPHAFSWLVWGVLNAVAFAGQVHGKGGAGTWAVGLTAATMFVIFALSVAKGEKEIKTFDWVCLILAALAVVPWLLTSKPLLSVVLITIIDVFGFLPTARKAYKKPHQETLATFSLSTLKYLLVVLALEHYNLVTSLFPAAVALMNGAFVAMLLIRRRQCSV